MIRPAMAVCRDARLELAAVLFAVALALLVPGALGMTWAVSSDVANEWLKGYEPVIYLEGDTTVAQTESLVADIESWPSVGDVRVRTPDEAYTDLVERLGAESVAELGIRPEMLPTSVVLSPSAPVGGHIDLIPAAAALEARMEVDAVEVPDDAGVRVLMLSGLFGALALLAMVFSILAAVVILSEYLRRLLSRESSLNDALELFGAPPVSIRKPTLIRGATIGAWAGTIASVVLVMTLVAAQGFVATRLGLRPSMAFAWPIAFAPVVVGTIAGAIVGLWVSAPRRRPSELAPVILNRWSMVRT